MSGGKRIRQAEVQVRFPADADGESRLLTDGDERATFKAAGPGKARASALQEVTLKEGAQQITITLTPLAEAGQLGDGKRRGDGKR
jgi:hypothetical protein